MSTVKAYKSIGSMEQRSRLGGAEYVKIEDFDALQSRLNAVEAENERMREALKFYAEKNHFCIESDDWDSVSGEPHNILWHPEEASFLEDGFVARKAFEGKA